MSAKTALTLSVGLLGAVSTWLTATLLPVPVWVLFLAWACFFLLDGGMAGVLRTVASNLTGIAIATVTLLLVTAGGESVLLLGAAVGLGSAAMIQASRVRLLSAAPAIVVGFAMTVGTIAATDLPITTASISNPALLATFAVLAGAAFGIVSELLAGLLATRRSATQTA